MIMSLTRSSSWRTNPQTEMKLKDHFSVDKLREREAKRNASGRFNRIGAYILDHFICAFGENLLIFLLWLILLGLGKVTAGGDINLSIFPKELQVPVILLILILVMAYHVILPHFFLEDQTFGKRLIGLKIVRTDGSKPTLGNYLRRLVGMLLEGNAYVSLLGGVHYLLYYQFIPQVADTLNNAMGWIFALSVVIGLFHPERRAIHDFIAGTKVVYTKPHDLVDYSRPISKDIDLSNM